MSSLLPFYHKPLIWKSQEVVALNTTTTVWTPASGKRVVLESALISAYGPTSGTVALYFGLDSLSVAPTRVTLLAVNSSSAVQVIFGGMDNQRVDQPVRIITAAVPVSVTLMGFELEN